jgi:hypothetical protein
MKINSVLATIALLVGAIFIMASTAWAQEAVGGAELRLLELFLTGTYGITIGLGVAIFGLWQISQSNMGFGIILLIVGACITFAPGILNGTRAFVCPITKALGHNVECRR